MRLEVVTPKGTLLSQEADEVTAPGVLGEFGVLPGHVPFLTGLRPGVLSYRHGGSSGVVAVGAGYVEVAGDRVVVLAGLGQLAADIDTAAAQAELDAAQKKLDAHAEDDGLRTELEAQRGWAQARLEAAAHKGGHALPAAH